MARFILLVSFAISTVTSRSPVLNAEQCKAPHEKYMDCPDIQCYPKTCDELVNPPDCRRMISVPCLQGGCICEYGYLRNSEGICIKKEQCTTAQCKKPHQRFTECLAGVCHPKYCDEVGNPVTCPYIYGPCRGGCNCESGFVWDSNKDCIDMKNCPSCGGDPNAVSGCGNPCGKTCEDLYRNKSELVCPQDEYCNYNGCDCKPGYLLLNAGYPKKCIPEKECPKPSDSDPPRLEHHKH